MDEVFELDAIPELATSEQFVKMIVGAIAAFAAGKVAENVVEKIIRNRRYKTV